MYLELPQAEMTQSNSCLINKDFFPYPIDFYDSVGDGEIRTLKVVLEEVYDVARRYAIIYPSTVQVVEEERYTGFRMLVNDDSSGISRGLLERIGYTLEESDFTPFGIYWIVLKTRGEKGKKK